MDFLRDEWRLVVLCGIGMWATLMVVVLIIVGIVTRNMGFSFLSVALLAFDWLYCFHVYRPYAQRRRVAIQRRMLERL